MKPRRALLAASFLSFQGPSKAARSFEHMHIDIYSPTWQALTQQLAQDRETLRERLEQVGLPTAETEALRGELRRIKAILALANPPTREGGDTPDYGHQPAAVSLL